MQLSRGAIAQTAVDILDEYGFADVSMRRVAGALGVAPGALYWHVDNKQALIGAMADLIVDPVLGQSHAGPREFCAALRTALLGHRDGADVVSSAVAHPGSATYSRLVAAARATLPDVGDTTDAAAAGLLYLTLGAASIYQAGEQLKEATNTTGGASRGSEASVEHAIELLLRGLEGG